MLTNVYVDAFNLYYGCLKGTPYRWLDLDALCRQLLPRDQIHRIRYLTALVSGRPGDLRQPQRQQAYLLLDGSRGDSEAAVVISNDSDLKVPIALAQAELRPVVGVVTGPEEQSAPADVLAAGARPAAPVEPGSHHADGCQGSDPQAAWLVNR